MCLPYSMNPFLEKGCLRTLSNKLLHLLEFVYTTHFKPPRVMKDEARVASEDHLVFDVVIPTLAMCQPHTTWTTESTVPLVLTPADSWIRA